MSKSLINLFLIFFLVSSLYGQNYKKILNTDIRILEGKKNLSVQRKGEIILFEKKDISSTLLMDTEGRVYDPQSISVYTSKNGYAVYIQNELRSLVLDSLSWRDGKVFEEKSKLHHGCGLDCNEESSDPIPIQKRYSSLPREHKVIPLKLWSDYEFLLAHNNDPILALGSMLAIVSSGEEFYKHDFQDSITFTILEVTLSLCESCDLVSSEISNAVRMTSTFEYKVIDEPKEIVRYLFTGRNLDHLYLGLALNDLCERGTGLSAFLNHYADRIIFAHELGHIIGVGHAPEGIMSASLGSQHYWADVSITWINSFISQKECLDNTLNECFVDDVNSYVSGDSLHVTWNPNSIDSLELIIVSSNSDTLTSTVLYEGDYVVYIEQCLVHNVSLTPLGECNLTTITHTFAPSDFGRAFVEQVIIEHCSPTLLQVKVETYNGDSMCHFLSIEDQLITIDTGFQTFFLSIPNRNGSDILFSVQDSMGSCLSRYVFQSPFSNCDRSLKWDFNDGSLQNWRVETTNDRVYQLPVRPYRWNIVTNDRYIHNYSYEDNGLNTIDGSHMAVIDDDIKASPSHTGTTRLISPVLNIEDHNIIIFSLDHIFDTFEAKGDNNSSCIMGVFVDDQRIVIDSFKNTTCSWTEHIWLDHCSTRDTFDLSQYADNSIFELFIEYTDGGDSLWTGMCAIDNMSLSLIREKCPDESLFVDGADGEYSEVDTIHATGPIVGPVSFTAGDEIELLPGFQVEVGKVFVAEVRGCPH